MTIAAAVLSEWNLQPVIITVSDRMVTCRDIQYEPENVAKCSRFGPAISRSILALPAGDLDIHKHITAETSRKLRGYGKDVDVATVAELYNESLVSYKNKKAEKRVLEPLGLCLETFVSDQKNLESGLVMAIAENLWRKEEIDIAAIIAGVDSMAHTCIWFVKMSHCFVATNSLSLQ